MMAIRSMDHGHGVTSRAVRSAQHAHTLTAHPSSSGRGASHRAPACSLAPQARCSPWLVPSRTQHPAGRGASSSLCRDLPESGCPGGHQGTGRRVWTEAAPSQNPRARSAGASWAVCPMPTQAVAWAPLCTHSARHDPPVRGGIRRMCHGSHLSAMDPTYERGIPPTCHGSHL